MPEYLIAPSILSADFARLGEEVTSVLAAGADIVHFDVMDNHYVPNLTIGPLICEALRNHGVEAPIDVHVKQALSSDSAMPDGWRSVRTTGALNRNKDLHDSEKLGRVHPTGRREV